MRKTYSNSSRSSSVFEDDDLGEQPGFLSEQEEPRPRRAARNSNADAASRYDLPAARTRRAARPDPQQDSDDEATFDFDTAPAPAWENEPQPRRKRARRNPDEPTRWQWMLHTTLGRWVLGLLVLVLLGVLAAAAWGVREFLRTDPHFRIATSDQIAVEGNQQVATDQARAVFGEDIGRNLFFVPIRLRQQQLEQLPWVEHATVERLLPNHLRVKIAERTPIAFAQNGDRVLLIDRHGALLDLPAGADAARLSFPVLDGMGQDVPLGVRQARMGLYLAFIRELDSHGEKVSARLSEVDLSDPDDTIGIFDENGSAIALHFGDHNFFERYQIYQTHLAEWQQQYPRLAKVDLRNAPQIVLGMAAGAPPPTSAAAGSAPAPQPSPATTPVSASDASTSNASASNPSASNVPAQPSLATTQPNSKPSAAGTQPAAAAHKAAAPKTAAKPNQKPSPKPVAKHPKPAAKADSKTAARPVAKSAAKPAARLTPAQQVFKNQPPRAPSALPALRLAQHPAALPKPIANQEGPQ